MEIVLMTSIASFIIYFTTSALGLIIGMQIFMFLGCWFIVRFFEFIDKLEEQNIEKYF